MESTKKLLIKSEEFKDNGFIPAKYTCDGENISPPLAISEIPSEAKTLAIIVEDPDVKTGVFIHWLAWNIPVLNHLPEHNVSGLEGTNDFKKTGYMGPCPPEGETHHYIFRVFALDKVLPLTSGENEQALQKAMENHVLAHGEIIGLYKKQDKKALEKEWSSIEAAEVHATKE